MQNQVYFKKKKDRNKKLKYNNRLLIQQSSAGNFATESETVCLYSPILQRNDSVYGFWFVNQTQFCQWFLIKINKYNNWYYNFPLHLQYATFKKIEQPLKRLGKNSLILYYSFIHSFSLIAE